MTRKDRLKRKKARAAVNREKRKKWPYLLGWPGGK
jgi:hypothetical protein